MVALAVGGVVVAAAYAAVATGTDHLRRARGERDTTLAAVNARRTLADWLRAATALDGAAALVGEDRGTAELPADEVTVVVADGGALYPGPRRVRLFVWRGTYRARDTTALVAELAPLRGTAAVAWDTVVLAPGVVGLDAQFHTRVGGRERWIGAWRGDSLPPDGIALRVLYPPLARGRGATWGATDVLAFPLVVRLATPTR